MKQQLMERFPFEMRCATEFLCTLFICVLSTRIPTVNSVPIKNYRENLINAIVNDAPFQTIVTLPKYGQLQGSIGLTAWTNQTILQFLNVPYAESPSGPRRFKAPVPIRLWKGIFNAQNYGRKCPTLEDLLRLTENELRKTDVEDCLNMAIYSKNLNASNPVMVFIHGGGFVSGSVEQYPPNYLLEGDIILVVIQFRLSVLGFMSTKSREIPGNAGLLDCVQALKFIKENIQHFGGDANKITVFGQSSGAVMVSALVISPAVPANLFQRAIAQSGSIFASWAYSTDPVQDAQNIAEAAGLNPNQSIATLNRAFMSMNVLKLFQAVQKSDIKIGLSRRQPIAGKSLSIGGPNELLPDLPEKIIQSAKYKKSIPLIIGTTKTDGSYPTTGIVTYDFLAITNRLNDKDFIANDLVDALYQFLGIEDDTGTLAGLTSRTFWPNRELSSGDFGICTPGIIDMLGTSAFKAPALKFAQLNKRINPNGTFLYTFDYKGEHTRFGYGADVSHYPFSGGVHHSDDLIYLFPYPSDAAKLNAADTKIAQMMVDLWSSFAIDGVPKLPRKKSETNEKGDRKSRQWKPFNDQNGPYLRIDQSHALGLDFRVEFTVVT